MSFAFKDDLELLRLSAKKAEAFKILVDRYQQPFLRRATMILRNADEAEDAVQDTFLKIYIYADQFKERPGATFSSWAYKILLNSCFVRYRKLKQRRERELSLDAENAPALSDSDSPYERKVVLDYLVSMFAVLPRVLRRVMTLHYLRGWTFEELALAEGVSPGAIRTRIHRAKKILTKLAYARPRT